MKLRDTFDGNGRFEGDRLLRWRSIPADARIVSARATVRPLPAFAGGPFVESLSFNGVAEFGATKNTATSWVEVDFHTRRTLARVTGTFANATLQVDVGGGTYVEINEVGAFRTPSDTTLFRLTGNSVSLPLPALTVAKLKLTSATVPVITSVSVTSVPANVSLRVGELAPFFTHPGEMTQPETSVDFSAVLQAALTSAKVETGFYDLPLTIHSDSIARLQVELEVDFLLEQNPLPNDLAEVVLPFDYSTLAQSPAATLNVAVPPNTRVVPGQTSARVRGTFAESRVAFPNRIGAVKPVAAVEVSPGAAQAQLVAVDTEITATAIDLLLESKTLAARLRLDVRADLDGKPDDTSLFATPVEFAVSQETGKGARWTSVQLPSEFVFSSARRYWLALQSLEGEAAWSVDNADDLNMQSTRDGGLSWRDSLAMPGTQRDQTVPAAGPFAAFFRLRTQPKTFNVPIELQVGRDQCEVRVKLDRFDPLGRVDFTLDTELAEGINKSLATTPVPCPETEHLFNGDFEQWLRLGDEIKPQADFKIGAPISSVAFSPDGKFAYVLDQGPEKIGFIVVIDAACNQVIEEKRIQLAINDPTAFVISPDGTRAFVIDDDVSITKQRVQIVDLSTGRVLGAPFDLDVTPTTDKRASDLAISPDGSRLYVATLGLGAQKENRIHVINTGSLEQHLLTGLTVPSVVEKKVVAADGTQERAPMSLAVSPDGKLLYMVTDRDQDTDVIVVETNTFSLVGAPIVVGQEANSIVITPDGSQAVVTNKGNDNISIINTRNSSITTVPVGAAPIDVTISPDGTKAYVLNQTARTISVVDLNRHIVVGTPIPLPPGTDPTAVALALSPQGDQIYVANDEDAASEAFVSPLQLGARVPAEWQLTSGEVGPYCLADPFHRVAILGSDTRPTGVSQVVPVTESCTYEFSFWGIALDPPANEPPAMAEVLWLGKQCRPIGPNPDPVPIKTIENPPAVSPPVPFGAKLFARNALGQTAALKFHRVCLQAPAGVDQAEVRFSVPATGTAAIDQVSLTATAEAIANSDFQLRENSQISHWTISPAAAPGFAVLESVAGAIQLRNSSAVTVELVQVVEAKQGQPFAIEVQGKALPASSAQGDPEVEVRWFKTDGKATGSPTIVAMVSDAFASATATGIAPSDATKAEIHLRLPARTAAEVKRISLRFTTPTIVPLSFLAQSPGELVVSDIRIAFEQVEPVAPPIPDRGLCAPTPPGREPGSHDCCCPACGSEQTVDEASEMTTESGRAAMLARCESCGTEFLRVSGVTATEARVMSESEALTRPVVVGRVPVSVERAALQPEARTFRLTDLRGVAEPRAQRFIQIGIDSVAKLAAATPEQVVESGFITRQMASKLIEQAKALVG